MRRERSRGLNSSRRCIQLSRPVIEVPLSDHDQVSRPARVLDVGNCDPDHGSIKWVIESEFDARVDRVMFVPDALQRLRETAYDLVLVNRLIFEDQSDGMELVRAAQADATLRTTPVMLVSNYPEAQQAAVAAGAAPGFGKARLGKPDMLAAVEKFLPRKRSAATRKE